MAKKKHDFVYVDVYKALVYVSFDRKHFEKGLMDRFGVEHSVDFGNAGQCSMLIDDDGAVMFTIFADKDDFNLGTLVHECVHCAMFILGNRGVEIDADNHEALTYLTQHLFEKCHEIYLRTK